jgi:serine/threonine-protein kinase
MPDSRLDPAAGPLPTLAPGTHLGPYEVLGPLGAGGMGEVFRARDPRLGRDVAIKALPAAFAQDPERLARFEREAKLLASLSHPNIAGLLGLEEAGGARYLVLEFVDGETLAARLARGALPLDEALEVGRQIAAGVEAAHESGVVHRDLKPGNVMLTPQGGVKVLDFGLAKAAAAAGERAIPSSATGGAAASASPTMTYAPTEVGLVLGTAAYMSPEQARGRAVDKRSDIWSFGCVLFECLSGRPAFQGETVSDTIATILKGEPDYAALPAATPRRVRELLGRCLCRDPRERLRDIGEARIALAAAAAPGEAAAAEPTPGGTRRRLRPAQEIGLTIVGAVLAALAGVIATRLLSRPPAPAPLALSVMLPRGERLEAGIESNVFALAPDGRSIVYAARGDGPYRLFLRRLGERAPLLLPGTEEGHNPFLSPDGEWVGFFAESRLKKVSVHGGTPVELAETGADRAAAWLPDDTIVYSPTFSSALYRIPAAGGTPTAVTTVDSAAGERTHRFPCALPGGEWIVFTVGTLDNPGDYENASIEAVSLRSGERRKIARGSSARFAPPHHLVVARSGSLYAQRLDPRDPRGGGTPVPVFDGVLGQPTAGAVYFDIARDGTLALVPGRPDQGESHLGWMDLEGRLTLLPGEARPYRNFELSPDGTQAIAEIGGGGGSNTDIHIVDLARGSTRQITFDQRSASAKWMPDGRRAVWVHTRTPCEVVLGSLSGTDSGRVLVSSPGPLGVTDVSADGRLVLFSEYGPVNADVHVVATDGAGAPRPLIADPRAQTQGALSPDGRWVAYTTDGAGQREVWIKPVDRPGHGTQITTRGGMLSLWAPDGRTLYVVSGVRVEAVPLRITGDLIEAEAPRRLFDLPVTTGDGSLRDLDLHPSGTKFLVRVPAEDATEMREIAVVTGWARTLGKDARAP